MIRVSDDGRGIEPRMLPRIFDLFVQGDQSLARSEGGLGIGLTLLRSLVELHNGRVEAHSDGPGAAASFTVWLPLAPTRSRRGRHAPAAAADGPHGRARRGSARRAPDDAAAARVAGRQGASPPRTASKARELIERVQPDLALVDLGLPVMSGFELARRLRIQSPTVNAPGRPERLRQDSDIQAALDAGFDEHLTKAADPTACSNC